LAQGDKNGTALVTAGAKRIGRAIALKLADLGFDIALHFNSSNKEAELTKRDIENKGRTCLLFQANLNDSHETSKLIESITNKMPNISLLINNASVFKRINFLDSTIDDFEHNFNIHVKTPYILTRDFAKYCRDGQVINIIDANIVHYQTNYFPYLLTKKVLSEFTMMAACELAPNIRVNAIAPGLIMPPAGREDRLDRKDNLLQHTASVDYVLLAMEYLLVNKHVTGQSLFVDGGDHLVRVRQDTIKSL
jgi:NAD(P)-dependent dehydrogenase (short-subunit alcohol dehydrogenase family)